MAKNQDWAKQIIDRQTAAIMSIMAGKMTSGREREKFVRQCLRTCIRETLKATSSEMQYLIQDELEKSVPQFTTEMVARKLEVPMSTFRLYIARGIVVTPDKIANKFLWSEEQAAQALKAIRTYRTKIGRRT